jgi:hypothetical protein
MDPETEISPGKRVHDWTALRPKLNNADDAVAWEEAVGILRGRLESRVVEPLRQLMNAPWSVQHGVGFALAALDCLLIDTIQSFKEGRAVGGARPKPARSFSSFLRSSAFAQQLSSSARTEFFDAIRNGVMHDLETRHGWLIRESHPDGARVVDRRPVPQRGFILYRTNFHRALEQEVETYLTALRNDEGDFRTNFLRRMDSICGLSTPPLRIRYFAYGSNMDPMVMKREGVRSATPIGIGHASGYRVVFNKISAKHGAAANLQLDEETNSAWGCLYDLERDEFDRVKKKEVGYFDRTIDVELDSGEKTEAQVFVACSASVRVGRPSAQSVCSALKATATERSTQRARLPVGCLE